MVQWSWRAPGSDGATRRHRPGWSARESGLPPVEAGREPTGVRDRSLKRTLCHLAETRGSWQEAVGSRPGAATPPTRRCGRPTMGPRPRELVRIRASGQVGTQHACQSDGDHGSRTERVVRGEGIAMRRLAPALCIAVFTAAWSIPAGATAEAGQARQRGSRPTQAQRAPQRAPQRSTRRPARRGPARGAAGFRPRAGRRKPGRKDGPPGRGPRRPPTRRSAQPHRRDVAEGHRPLRGGGSSPGSPRRRKPRRGDGSPHAHAAGRPRAHRSPQPHRWDLPAGHRPPRSREARTVPRHRRDRTGRR